MLSQSSNNRMFHIRSPVILLSYSLALLSDLLLLRFGLAWINRCFQACNTLTFPESFMDSYSAPASLANRSTHFE